MPDEVDGSDGTVSARAGYGWKIVGGLLVLWFLALLLSLTFGGLIMLLPAAAAILALRQFAGRSSKEES